MIEDPIVIRKARGNLIVASLIETDPVQMIRQLNDKELEVHLRNGSKYLEKVGDSDLQSLILELMGYGIIEVNAKISVWQEDERGEPVPKSDLNAAGVNALEDVFTKTPYMQSKFLSAKMWWQKRIGKSYCEDDYTILECSIQMRFLGRVDMVDAITNECYTSSFFRNFFVQQQNNQTLIQLDRFSGDMIE